MKYILLLLILVTACTQQITPETCKLSGGDWNNCGSSCTTEESDFCIQSCQPQCECTEDSQCPNQKCEHLLDKKGKCI